MFWRRNAASKELLVQAGAVAELTRSVARYFRAPSEPAAVAARSRARAALDAGRAAQAALKGYLDREDWLAVSRALAELAEQAARGVAQAKLYGVERQTRLAKAALDLGESAVELGWALRRSGQARASAEHLVEAKRLISSVDEVLSRARRASLEDPREVTGLKDREVYRRLADAAQAAHAAADRLAEVLSDK